MFFHWKGEVRLSPPPSYVIRPGKSWENFNSKFSANLDFKEFELLSLNWQLVYIPWKIKGARKKSSLIWISRRSSVPIIISKPLMDMPGKVTRWLTGWAIWHGGGGSSFTWKPRKTFQITIFRKKHSYRVSSKLCIYLQSTETCQWREWRKPSGKGGLLLPPSSMPLPLL